MSNEAKTPDGEHSTSVRGADTLFPVNARTLFLGVCFLAGGGGVSLVGNNAGVDEVKAMRQDLVEIRLSLGSINAALKAQADANVDTRKQLDDHEARLRALELSGATHAPATPRR